MKLLLLAAMSAALFVGCHLSVGSHTANHRNRTAHQTGKEINEYELLGISPESSFETEIEKALTAAKDLRIAPNSAVMLIKSGQSVPDQKMSQALERNFRVATFTGIPSETASNSELPYPKAIRLAAARAGAETILCYWAKLESSTQELPTSLVSWAPVLDLTLPHETQSLRLTVKMAVIDVRSGNWALFNTQPFERKGIRTASASERNDQTHVEALRQIAYTAAVDELVKRFSR